MSIIRSLLRWGGVEILSLRYYKAFHRRINLKNPTLFYEKIFWLSLHTDTTMWSKLADKYEVREWVEKTYSKDILSKLLGVWDSPEEIDYEHLPKSFVLKTNNGCASNILVRDKDKLDIEKTNKQLRKWLKFPYGELTGQKHYTRIKPRIIAEEFLYQKGRENASLTDYKFFCFDGEVRYCNLLTDRVFNTHTFRKNMYDMQWQAHSEVFIDHSRLNNEPKPVCFDEMVKIASTLSKGFPFVRVDLYEINEKPIFGEMTFMPGLDMNFTMEFQKQLGDMVKIEKT